MNSRISQETLMRFDSAEDCAARSLASACGALGKLSARDENRARRARSPACWRGCARRECAHVKVGFSGSARACYDAAQAAAGDEALVTRPAAARAGRLA